MWNPFSALTTLYNIFVSQYNHFSVAVSMEENSFSCQLLKVTSVWGGEMSLFFGFWNAKFLFHVKGNALQIF